MFSFFKKLVKPKEELQIIALAELPSWLEQEQKARHEAAHKEFESKFNEHREQLGLFGTSIEALRAAQLLNPNIPERAKQLMEGNREEFIRLVERLAHGVMPPVDLEDAPRYRSTIHSVLQEIIPSASRPFQVLQEFFAHETKEVWKHVHFVEQQAIAMSTIKDAHKLGILQQLKKELGVLNSFESRKKSAQTTLSAVRDETARLETQRLAAQTAIAALEQSIEYQVLLSVKKQLQTTTDSLKQIRASFSEQFSALEPALKKYEHMTLHNRQLIRDYLANPVETLARDRELMILQVIAAMRREVQNDRIDLKDRKKDKVLAAMDSITKESLDVFFKRYGALLGEQNKLVADAEKMHVLRTISDARKQLQGIEEQLLKLRQTENETKSALEQKADYSSIESLLKEHFQRRLR